MISGAMGLPPNQIPAGFQSEQPKSAWSFGGRLDPIMVFIWAASTMLPMDYLGPVRYIAAGYFALGVFIFAPQILPAIGRACPLLLLPILCTLSALWAPSSAEAIRKGLSLGLTGIVAVYAARRVSGRHILIAYFIVELIAALLSLTENRSHGSGGWSGIYDQKNYFAVHMFILFIAAMTISLDKDNKIWLRLVALATLPLAAFMIVMSQSGTSIALTLVASIVMLGYAFVWKPAARIQHARTLIAAVIVIGALLTGYICIGILQIDVKEEILQALGKDSTLTGRTMLWSIAERQMQDHPLTGLGANGYWRSENSTANTITNIIMGWQKLISFSFHNSYLENGVNYGYPGYIATAIVVAWACISAALTWLRNQSVVNSGFLVLALLILLRTFSEIDLALEYSGTAVLLFIAGARRERLVKTEPTFNFARYGFGAPRS